MCLSRISLSYMLHVCYSFQAGVGGGVHTWGCTGCVNPHDNHGLLAIPASPSPGDSGIGEYGNLFSVVDAFYDLKRKH